MGSSAGRSSGRGERDRGSAPGNDAPATVLAWLLARYPGERRDALDRLIESRRVLVNGSPATRLKQAISTADQLTLAPLAKRPDAKLGALVLVHEDDDVIVIDKPPELLTSTNARERRPTALKLVTKHVNDEDGRGRVWLVHRLDRDASGLLVFAKSRRAIESLKRQFFEHTIERQYLARVHGLPEPRSGSIAMSLVERADGSVRPSSPDDREPGEDAVTRYEVLHAEGGSSPWSLVRVVLHTGRKHQIRAHLSAIGHPLVGDAIYEPESLRRPNQRMLLRAMVLGLDHPGNGRRERWVASLPAGIPQKLAACFTARAGGSAT